MIRAYDEIYLKNAQSVFATSLDYAVNTLGYELNVFYDMFIKSDLLPRFERGDPFIISGMSGIELALLVVEKKYGESHYIAPHLSDKKSVEYWVGWILAFYQWYSAISLLKLQQEISIEQISLMYDKYHEMDVMHFVEDVNQMRSEARVVTYLQELRKSRGLSQSQLASLCDIPLRTLQHYEQGTKSLSKANVEYVFRLSNALDCPMEMLIEGV